MEVDVLFGKLKVPDDLATNAQAQGELLIAATNALAALVKCSGMLGLQVTCEDPRNGDNVQVVVTPSEEEDDWKILAAMGSAINARRMTVPVEGERLH